MTCNVMVVEDDTDAREVLIEVLQHEGYSVEGASNGAEAIKLLERGVLPGIILLDVMMPVMDGHEVMRRLRAESGWSAIPVAIVSAVPTPPAGAAYYFLKPLDLDELLAVIQKHR